MSKRQIPIWNLILGFCLVSIQTGCNSVDRYKNISIECHDQMYACGECGQRCLVTKVPSGLSFIRDREIKVEWESPQLEAKYDSLVSKCAICYKHRFTGDLDVGSDTMLVVQDFESEMREGCCE